MWNKPHPKTVFAVIIIFGIAVLALFIIGVAVARAEPCPTLGGDEFEIMCRPPRTESTTTAYCRGRCDAMRVERNRICGEAPRSACCKQVQKEIERCVHAKLSTIAVIVPVADKQAQLTTRGPRGLAWEPPNIEVDCRINHCLLRGGNGNARIEGCSAVDSDPAPKNDRSERIWYFARSGVVTFTCISPTVRMTLVAGPPTWEPPPDEPMPDVLQKCLAKCRKLPSCAGTGLHECDPKCRPRTECQSECYGYPNPCKAIPKTVFAQTNNGQYPTRNWKCIGS